MPADIKLGVAFELNFGNPILEGMATIGKFDGKNPSLVCATAGGRIMVHTAKPKEKPSETEQQAIGGGGESSDIRFFNFNRTPTALLAAPIVEGSKNDYVVLGSQTNIQAYNVDKNSDAFFKDSQEAVTAMAFGKTNSSSEKLTFVGGNCSVLGFDGAGTERFWTVTSDVVTSLATLKWKNSFDALLAGSEDYDIRIFKDEEVAETITESDKIKKIHTIGNAPGRFAMALQNGTVGVYQDSERLWRFKSKHACTSLTSCDLDYDGVEEILCGWTNGKFDVRADGNGRKGEAVFKESYASPVNGIVTADYRHDGRTIPLVCTYDGVVRGYVAMETTAEEAIDTRDRGMLEDLMSQKQALQIEIGNLEKQIAKQATGQADTTMPSTKATVKARVRPNAANKCIDLVISTTEGLVRGVSITGELLFSGSESAFYYAEGNPTDSLACPIKTEKDVATELKISVIVGLSMSDNFQVHDITFTLPKFAMYLPVREIPQRPQGSVTGKLADRVSRFQLWVSNSFSIPPSEVLNNYQASFVSVRDGSTLTVAANNGEFTIYCDDMDVAGAMVQDLAAFLGVTELTSTCDYPKEFEAFNATLQRVEEYNTFRMKLTAEMADSTQLVKAFVIKAEDARILQDMKTMKKMYSSLYEVNRELMGEYMKRSNNHTELLAALKDVNSMIQKAANLRVGNAKTSVVNDCRAAIKAKNNAQLFKIIKTGSV